MRFFIGVICITGCFNTVEDDVFIPETPDLAVASDLSQTDGPPSLPSGPGLGSGRARPPDQSAQATQHISPGASVSVPDQQYGFTVTANGQGGYRVAWVDAASVGLRFHGSVFVHGSFDQIQSVGMNYATASGERLDFESKPGAGTLGYVDFVSSTDPITVDALAGSQPGLFFFVDGNGTSTTTSTPATFTSP
jgi:hypothetical protein